MKELIDKPDLVKLELTYLFERRQQTRIKLDESRVIPALILKFGPEQRSMYMLGSYSDYLTCEDFGRTVKFRATDELSVLEGDVSLIESFQVDGADILHITAPRHLLRSQRRAAARVTAPTTPPLLAIVEGQGPFPVRNISSGGILVSLPSQVAQTLNESKWILSLDVLFGDTKIKNIPALVVRTRPDILGHKALGFEMLIAGRPQETALESLIEMLELHHQA